MTAVLPEVAKRSVAETERVFVFGTGCEFGCSVIQHEQSAVDEQSTGVHRLGLGDNGVLPCGCLYAIGGRSNAAR